MFNPNQAFLLVQNLKSSPKLLINAELYGLVLAPRLGKKRKKDTIEFGKSSEVLLGTLWGEHVRNLGTLCFDPSATRE
jgi:hypothetical protein